MDFSNFDIWTWAPIGAGALLAATAMFSYNQLASLASRCNRAIADIDVQLQHRHALLPNLLELLKGAQIHDLAIIDSIAKAQRMVLEAISPQARMQAEHALSMNLQQAFVVADKIPELQANGHFKHLRREVADCENKISAARRFLNLAVDEYNATRDQFPNNLFAWIFGHGEKQFYALGQNRAVIEEGPVLKMS
jgi:LemA protein